MSAPEVGPLDGIGRVAAANLALAREQARNYRADLLRAQFGAGGPRGAARAAVRVAKGALKASGPPGGEALPELQPVAASRGIHEYGDWVAVAGGERAPLRPVTAADAERVRLHVAFLIPPFGYGSGGHEIVFRTVHWLERAGHTCSLWLHDPFGAERAPASVVRHRIVEEFGVAIDAPLRVGLGDWFGADVAVATGWQTVWPLMRLTGCGARAYLVNDDETSFYATSLETRLAAATYDEDLYCIAGTAWMLDRLRARHGVRGGHFDYPIGEAYRPRPIARDPRTVVVYGRMVTARRAVPLAIMALEELVARRGRDLRVVLFGNHYPPPAGIDYEFAGLVRPERLAWLYSQARVGVALSMTNTSLVPQDMAACGLPCVELEDGAAGATYGPDGPVELAPFDVLGVADAIERLLDDDARWERRSAAGLALSATRTWDRAGAAIAGELRAALRERVASGTAAI